MNTHRIRLIAFTLIGLLQLSAPLTMIARRERTLHQGTIHRFRAAPVDPYDPFRGRYVTINIASRSATLPANRVVQRGEQVVVSLITSEDGFTSCGSVLDRPPRDADWLWARVLWSSTDTAHLELPFDRYYMNEKQAPAAERVYFQHIWQRNDQQEPVWVSVRVHQGQTVLERLMIGERTIEEVITQAAQDQTP